MAKADSKIIMIELSLGDLTYITECWFHPPMPIEFEGIYCNKSNLLHVQAH